MVDSGTIIVPATPASITAATLFAPMFQINWQSSDGPDFAAAPRTSPSLSQPTDTGSPVPTATRAPSLVGTQTVYTDSSPTGGLEMASTSETVVATAAASSGVAGNDEDSGSQDDDQASKSDKNGSGFPVGATIGVSVAGGLGATAVAIWAVIMWQRRRQWKSEMLQGISDDRMLQLDSIYEAARPKTFDTAGRETMFGLDRQGTQPSRPGPDLMYGPGQETSRVLRAGPRRSPQLVGHFPGATMAYEANPTGLRDLPKDGGLGPYYYRQ
ncbi:hypothetical protein VMCG_08080 [Cytospora schulzeri]|uniref:Mid2 domain-containing protein n=1 Tax=Cytospora schulzeri TaxID=448051 RepID=A0A423VRI5_9PEZI|nr:hypothetical protein VMCG_08080 [Valsa malicola]